MRAAGRTGARLAGAAALVLAGPVMAQVGPFGHLHAPPRVVTSANEEAIWFGIDPSTFVIRLPDGFQSRNSRTEGESYPAHRPALSIHCRRSSPESQELGFSRESTSRSSSPGCPMTPPPRWL